MQKIEYLKKFRNALNTYNKENHPSDLTRIRQMYEYATNLDNLNEIQRKELNDFIAENTISLTHLANIYLDTQGIDHLNHQLKRMEPIHLTPTDSNMRFIKGDETVLSEALHPTVRVKVLCKTKNQLKAV